MSKLTRARFMSYFEGLLLPASELNRIWKQIESDLSGDKANTFIATYVHVYKARYQTSPITTGKAAGIAKRLVRDHGSDQACLWVTAYLQMSEYDFLRNRHDLVTMERYLQAIKNFTETGKIITRTEAHRSDKAVANQNAFSKALEKRRGQ